MARTRPFGSGVSGSRVFARFRGHDPDPPPAPAEPWDYADLAAELRHVADRSNATRALGVSLGAGALLRLVAETPERFERLVFVSPAAVDESYDVDRVTRFARLAHAAKDGAAEELVRLLLDEQPAEHRTRPDVRAWADDTARLLLRPDLIRALDELPRQAPITDRAALVACSTPALVVGAYGDRRHPARIARVLADALPQARLELLGAGGLLWSHRKRVREIVSGFLNDA